MNAQHSRERVTIKVLKVLSWTALPAILPHTMTSWGQRLDALSDATKQTSATECNKTTPNNLTVNSEMVDCGSSAKSIATYLKKKGPEPGPFWVTTPRIHIQRTVRGSLNDASNNFKNNFRTVCSCRRGRLLRYRCFGPIALKAPRKKDHQFKALSVYHAVDRITRSVSNVGFIFDPPGFVRAHKAFQRLSHRFEPFHRRHPASSPWRSPQNHNR
jgi:hypothetical protein